MKKFFILMCIFFVVSCSLTFGSASIPSAKKFDIYQAHKSVAQVYAKKADDTEILTGTAFAIDSDYLVTAGHVCSGIANGQATKVFGKEIYLGIVLDGFKAVEKGAKIIAYEFNEKSDVCILKRIGHGLNPLHFVNDYSNDVRFGEKEWIIGAPMGFKMAWDEGMVMDTNLQEYPPPFKNKLMVSSAIAPGNSGSPILDEDGMIIGMAVMVSSGFNKIGFCVRADHIQVFIAEHKK